MDIVKVVSVEALDRRRLSLRFSDGSSGIRDLSDVLAEGGPMVEPLRDEGMFRRVFVSFGVPTWPNGFDLDAIALHREMRDGGALAPAAA
jgi:hypothetical protein